MSWEHRFLVTPNCMFHYANGGFDSDNIKSQSHLLLKCGARQRERSQQSRKSVTEASDAVDDIFSSWVGGSQRCVSEEFACKSQDVG